MLWIYGLVTTFAAHRGPWELNYMSKKKSSSKKHPELLRLPREYKRQSSKQAVYSFKLCICIYTLKSFQKWPYFKLRSRSQSIQPSTACSGRQPLIKLLERKRFHHCDHFKCNHENWKCYFLSLQTGYPVWEGVIFKNEKLCLIYLKYFLSHLSS